VNSFVAGNYGRWLEGIKNREWRLMMPWLENLFGDRVWSWAAGFHLPCLHMSSK
jgi:hypothetical protein